MKKLNKQKQICIIGTDTGIGKTYITCNLLKKISLNNYKVKAIKPVATGLIEIGSQKINEDAYLLSKAINMPMSIDEVNPICFEPAIAPHIAAEILKYPLYAKDIIDKCAKVIYCSNYDFIFIEGVGGLMVPLNNTETYLDLLQMWSFPVILVVGIKLGCINHCILTYKQLIQHNIQVLGWIANCIDQQMEFLEKNINYLQEKLTCPLLAINPFNHELIINNNFNKIFFG